MDHKDTNSVKLKRAHARRLAAILFVVVAAVVIYLSYPTNIIQAVFLIGLIVLIYIFLRPVRHVPITSTS